MQYKVPLQCQIMNQEQYIFSKICSKHVYKIQPQLKNQPILFSTYVRTYVRRRNLGNVFGIIWMCSEMMLVGGLAGKNGFTVLGITWVHSHCSCLNCGTQRLDCLGLTNNIYLHQFKCIKARQDRKFSSIYPLQMLDCQ